MIKELCHDEAILSQRCEVATVEDESVAQDLIDTIKSLDDAGCLAANQIGISKKVCVYLDDAGEPHVLYNPRLVFGLGASKMEESCLTHEEVTKSTRYIKCKVAFDQICVLRGTDDPAYDRPLPRQVGLRGSKHRTLPLNRRSRTLSTLRSSFVAICGTLTP